MVVSKCLVVNSVGIVGLRFPCGSCVGVEGFLPRLRRALSKSDIWISFDCEQMFLKSSIAFASPVTFEPFFQTNLCYHICWTNENCSNGKF